MLAFALLLFFSSMLWYLAKGSLNEYLKSQVELQGYYYSGQATTLALADFSDTTGIVTFNHLSLTNLPNSQAQYALIIDNAHLELARQPSQHLLTTIDKIIINKLTLNIEQRANEANNIEQLMQNIRLTLAKDYPKLYPAISAKIYAAQNPTLNADDYAKSHPQAGPIIEHTKNKKKRSKLQAKIIISTIIINTLELNNIHADTINSSQRHNVSISVIGGKEGLVTNQIGGEILLHLLKQAN